MSSPPRRSPLYSAIVLAGVSLTSGTACGGSDAAATADDTGVATDTKSGDSALADTGTTSDAADTGSASDAKDTATTDADAFDAGDACPPDSELPVPPCSFIK